MLKGSIQTAINDKCAGKIRRESLNERAPDAPAADKTKKYKAPTAEGTNKDDVKTKLFLNNQLGEQELYYKYNRQKAIEKNKVPGVSAELDFAKKYEARFKAWKSVSAENLQLHSQTSFDNIFDGTDKYGIPMTEDELLQKLEYDRAKNNQFNIIDLSSSDGIFSKKCEQSLAIHRVR